MTFVTVTDWWHFCRFVGDCPSPPCACSSFSCYYAGSATDFPAVECLLQDRQVLCCFLGYCLGVRLARLVALGPVSQLTGQYHHLEWPYLPTMGGKTESSQAHTRALGAGRLAPCHYRPEADFTPSQSIFATQSPTLSPCQRASASS